VSGDDADQTAAKHEGVGTDLRRGPRSHQDELLTLEHNLASPELGITLAARGTFELAEHKWADAAKFEAQAIAAYEAIGGPEHFSLWKARGTGRRAPRARPEGGCEAAPRPAIAIGTKAQISADDMNPIRDALANL